MIALGVEIRLYAGTLKGHAASKKDTVQIEWANKVENKVFSIGSREIYYQPCLRKALSVDLVIVIQESKLILSILTKKLCEYQRNQL